MNLAVVDDRVVTQQHDGFDLLHAVQYSSHAGVGTNGSPDSANGGGGEHSNECVGVVGDEASNSITSPHVCGEHTVPALSDAFSQLRPTHSLPRDLGGGDDGWAVRVDFLGRKKEILGKVESSALEEGGAWV